MTSEDVDLKAGEIIQLQFKPDAANKRYQARLIGYIKGKTLLTTTPLVNNKPIAIKEGQQCICRMMIDYSIYAFNSKIVHLCTHPYHYIHMLYPNRIERSVVRTEARMDVGITAKIAILHDDNSTGKSVKAYISDLSLSGCKLSTQVNIGKASDNIQINALIYVAGFDEVLCINGIIRNIRPAGEKTFDLGIQFAELERDQQLLLHGFLYEKIITDRI